MTQSSDDSRDLETLEKIIKPYRDQIRHEDILFNQRITWLMAFQAFLIAPFSIIENEPKAPQIENIQILLVSIGIFSAFFVLLGCFAAHQSINNLINSASTKLKKDTKHTEELLMRNSGYIKIAGALPSFGNIILISIIWMILLFNNISNINYPYKLLLIAIAVSTALFSCINLISIIFQPAKSSLGTAQDMTIEKIYAVIAVTTILYPIMTISYIALSASSPHWWSMFPVDIGIIFWVVILILIFTTRS